MGPDQGQARVTRDPNQTAEQRKQEADKAAYENREGGRAQRLAQEDAARRLEIERDREYAANEYEAQRAYEDSNPLTAFVPSGRPDPAKVRERRLWEESLEAKKGAVQRWARAHTPRIVDDGIAGAKELFDRTPVATKTQEYVDSKKPVRQPTSFQRDPRVEIGPAEIEHSVEIGPAEIERPYSVEVGPAELDLGTRAPINVRTRADGGEVMPLYEPEGQQLHQSLDGHAYLASNTPPTPQGASLSGPAPRYSAHAPVQSAPAPARRQPTPDELMRLAGLMGADMQTTHDARMAQGPAVSARAQGGAMGGLAASISRDLEKTKRYA
jgi:hypothetical protein